MVYRIHPAIGVARVGDSEEYYVAPESAGALPILPGGGEFQQTDFRDGKCRLRRQGARFEVIAYDEQGRERVVVPGRDGVRRIVWTVYVANKKATWYEFRANQGEDGYAPDHPLRNALVTERGEREKMIIDPGPRTVREPGQVARFSRFGDSQGHPVTFPPDDTRPFSIDTLGEIILQDDGRLVVLGGHGRSGQLPCGDRAPYVLDYANNDGWFDDTSDGPVEAHIEFDDDRPPESAESAWVVVAPPKYAPELLNLVTLWDTVFDVAVRKMGSRPDLYADGMWRADHRPNWERDVRPILERASRQHWAVAIPPAAHDFDWEKLRDNRPGYDGLRSFYLSVIRPPDLPNALASATTGYTLMPYMCGDNCVEPGALQSAYLTLTQTQYFVLRQWAAGRFDDVPPEPVGRGESLDRASLDCCVGGAFSPGIELTWISRNPLLYDAPFRIRRKKDLPRPLSLGGDLSQGMEPGDVARYMACPWQADFNECSQMEIGERHFWWWPAQRPNFVHVPAPGACNEDEPDDLLQVPWLGTDRDQTATDYVQFSDNLTMVQHWQGLGFVFNVGTEEDPRFIEVERTLPRRPSPHGGWQDVLPDV